MKQKTILILFVALLGLTSCIDDGKDEDVVTTVTLEVDAQPCDVYPIWGVLDTPPMPGMSIKEGKSSTWKKVPQTMIESFTYEPGYYYLLKVKKTIFANPPADARNYSYSLIKILKKEQR